MSAYSEEHSDLLPIDDDGEFLAHSKLLIDERHGIYIPQKFVETFYGFIDPVSHTEEVEGAISIVRNGPNDEWYWHGWDTIVDNVILLLFETGREKKYTLHRDGDLWAVPVSID